MPNNTWWHVRVDWESPDPLDEDLDALELVLEHLEGHSPAIGRNLVDGITEALVCVQAATVEEATKAALDLVAGATAETPIGVEATREDVFERRFAAS
jgi:hypothetical protein